MEAYCTFVCTSCGALTYDELDDACAAHRRRLLCCECAEEEDET